MSQAPIPNLHDLTAATTIPPALLTRTEADLSSFLERAGPILEAVRREGDAALLRFAREFDKVEAPAMSLRRHRGGIRARLPGDRAGGATRHRLSPSAISGASMRRRSPRRCG